MSKTSMMTSIKLITVGAVIGLVLGGGFAGKIWMDGESALDAERSAADAALGETSEAVDAMRGERDVCLKQADASEQSLAVLVSRVEIARATRDLDERNLGLANKHVTEAAAVLARAQSDDATAIRKRLEDTRLVIGVDPVEQRSELTSLAMSLDALLGE